MGVALACVPAPNLERSAAAVRTSKSLSRHFVWCDHGGGAAVIVPAIAERESAPGASTSTSNGTSPDVVVRVHRASAPTSRSRGRGMADPTVVEDSSPREAHYRARIEGLDRLERPTDEIFSRRDQVKRDRVAREGAQRQHRLQPRHATAGHNHTRAAVHQSITSSIKARFNQAVAGRVGAHSRASVGPAQRESPPRPAHKATRLLADGATETSPRVDATSDVIRRARTWRTTDGPPIVARAAQVLIMWRRSAKCTSCARVVSPSLR